MENNQKSRSRPVTAEREKTATAANLDGFKRAVNELIAKREYFAGKIMPLLSDGRDYYVIRGRRSLAKGGAEKLAGVYNLVATFDKDTETVTMLSDVKGMVAYVCTLTKNGVLAGQGRGADTLVRNGGDPNKTIKMAQKRAYVDAVIRTTGLSDIFTQDLEDMFPVRVTERAPFTGSGDAKPQAPLPERPGQHIVAVKRRLHELGANNEAEALGILTERSGLKLKTMKELDDTKAQDVLELLR